MNKRAFSEYCKKRLGCTVTEWKESLKWEGLSCKEINERLETLRIEFLSKQ
jgi:hypothetical protein